MPDLETFTLASLFVQSILYGIFICFFGVSSVIIISRRGNNGPIGGINVRLLSVSIAMFILATLHLACDLRRALDAFIVDNKGIGTVFLNAINTRSFQLKIGSYIAQTIVGDAFMIYRLYLVWNRNKWICVPVLATGIASFASPVIALCIAAPLSSAASEATSVFTFNKVKHWILAFMVLTFSTNAYSTVLIAGRIWWIRSQLSYNRGPRRLRGNLGPAATAIIESGATYSVCLLLLMGLYINGSYSQYIVLDALAQVIGLVFSLVIVRVALGVSSELVSTGVGARKPADTYVSSLRFRSGDRGLGTQQSGDSTRENEAGTGDGPKSVEVRKVVDIVHHDE